MTTERLNSLHPQEPFRVDKDMEHLIPQEPNIPPSLEEETLEK